ncbi:hypothetical protein BJ508DRAFT_378599 [Ascobolus immersus RN42]|uniref:Wax synthase domain-containing protein n=1 Tax=Ascobolus immersus RN42 TaxID=1160509 RepID=A0A3N4I0Y7_ASCIM|nr:hypothetical protein BJ508DRAFT_378599 [Ascobolus immersus RN42]
MSILTYALLRLSGIPFAESAPTFYIPPITNQSEWYTTYAPSLVSEPAYRGTWGIIYNCTFTLLLCVYTALHLDVPAYTEGTFVVVRRKIKWAIFCLIFPEIVMYSAFVRWQEAHALSRLLSELEKWKAKRATMEVRLQSTATGLTERLPILPLPGRDSPASQDKPSTPKVATGYQQRLVWMLRLLYLSIIRFLKNGWKKTRCLVKLSRRSKHYQQQQIDTKGFTLRYCHFVIMGGYGVNVDNIYDHASQLTLEPAGILALADKGFFFYTSDGDITDKSKADTIAKILVVFQVLQLLIQVIARGVKGLPICLLEWHTLAYVFCVCIMYFFWHAKPLNIGTRILLDTSEKLLEGSIALLLADSDGLTHTVSAESKLDENCRPLASKDLEEGHMLICFRESMYLTFRYGRGPKEEGQHNLYPSGLASGSGTPANTAEGTIQQIEMVTGSSVADPICSSANSAATVNTSKSGPMHSSPDRDWPISSMRQLDGSEPLLIEAACDKIAEPLARETQRKSTPGFAICTGCSFRANRSESPCSDPELFCCTCSKDRRVEIIESTKTLRRWFLILQHLCEEHPSPEESRFPVLGMILHPEEGVGHSSKKHEVERFFRCYLSYRHFNMSLISNFYSGWMIDRKHERSTVTRPKTWCKNDIFLAVSLRLHAWIHGPVAPVALVSVSMGAFSYLHYMFPLQLEAAGVNPKDLDLLLFPTSNELGYWVISILCSSSTMSAFPLLRFFPEYIARFYEPFLITGMKPVSAATRVFARNRVFLVARPFWPWVSGSLTESFKFAACCHRPEQHYLVSLRLRCRIPFYWLILSVLTVLLFVATIATLGRMFLLVESYISLRMAPAGVFVATPWAELIPHF